MVAWLTRLLLAVQLAVAALLAFVQVRVADTHPLAAFIFAAATIAAIRFLIVANNFRLSCKLSEGGVPPLSLGKWAALLWREYRASMAASSWHMPFPGNCFLPSKQEEQAPVLLLHGYGCNAGYWKPMRQAFDRAGISHAAISMEPVFGSIEDYLDDVDRAVRHLAQCCADGRVILIGHSMGGLVARAYLRRFGPDRIQGVITLGSPHHGTALAHVSAGKNCRQMERSTCRTRAGAWLGTLAGAESPAARKIIISIYSRHDNIIVPPCASVLEGCQNIALDGIGHVEMSFHKDVQQIVVQAIDRLRRASPDQQSRLTASHTTDQQTPLKQVDSR